MAAELVNQLSATKLKYAIHALLIDFPTNRLCSDAGSSSSSPQDVKRPPKDTRPQTEVC
jgi:hypothetical protein